MDETISGLDAEAYLFEPPETVWDRVLIQDHATWLDHKDMEALVRAAERTRAVNCDIPREAWIGLYASGNPLKLAPPPGMAVLHSLFRRAQELPEWGCLRLAVGMDPIAAAFGAAHFATELIDKLPPEVKEPMETAQRARDRAQQLQDRLTVARSLADGAGSAGQPPGMTKQNLESLITQVESDLADAGDQAAASEQAALQALDAAQARTAQSLATAINQSADDLSALQNAAAEFGVGWGLGGARTVTREQIAGLEQLSEYLRKSPSLKQILESLGWAKSLVTRERRRSTRGRRTFTHYKIQDLNLETLAPDELVSMIAFDPSSPIYLDFLCRTLDGDLLHAQFEGEDYAGRGPIVFLRDESGSMHGLRRATACALQLALMVEARREGRRFVSIPFSDLGQLQVYDPGPRPNPQELVAHLDTTYGGGTEPYGPLRKAIELIRSDPSLRAGDILCITDGDFGPPPKGFLQLLQEARADPGLKLVTVVINGRAGQANFADRVVMINDIVRDRERLAQAIGPLL
ncbi:MAG: hypothetical protein NTU91_17785 [Chloroflexi bacterium]|nr:hypothetical protein [Chloroflexota bacterium]